MRAAVLVAVSALVVAGCSRGKPEATAPPPAAAAAVAPAPTPAVTPEAVPAAEMAAAPAAAEAAAPAAQAVRFSPADYAKRERRLAALIANAETRDTLGETRRRADEGRYRRARCTTRACIESAYAAEEAWLRQWDGSGDVR